MYFFSLDGARGKDMSDGGSYQSAGAVVGEGDPTIGSTQGALAVKAPGLSSWSRFLVVPLSLTAFTISGYLAWSALVHGSVAGCSANGVWDCGHVLTSPWSKWMGIPVSIPAMALHLTLLTAVGVAYFGSSPRVRLIADRMLFFCACCAALAALWFIGLQVFVVGKLCKWCMGAHSAGIAACLVLMVDYGLRRAGGIPLRPLGGALAMTVILALSQVFGPVPETAIVTTYDANEPADLDIVDMDFEAIDAPEDNPRVGVEQTTLDDDQSAEVLATVTVESDGDLSEANQQHAGMGETDGIPVVATSTPEPAQDSDSALSTGDASDGPTVIYADDAEFTPTESPDDPSMTMENSPIPTPTPIPDAPQAESPVAGNKAALAAPRAVTFPGARTQLKVNQWPLIGSANARVIVAELFDYSCAHCRQMNRDLVIARAQFGNDLAVIALPVPLQSDCNPTVLQTPPEHRDSCELANLALAVWRVDPTQFADYHDWLCAAEPGRSAADARLEAERRVNAGALRAQLTGQIPGQYISRHIAIYQRAGEGTLPKLLSDAMTVTGNMSSAQSLCDTLQAKHGLAPVVR